MKLKQAFTLAEVLITLTIIGVVAAVTVPTLTKKTGNQEIVTRLQKVYSVLSQATDEIIYEKGSPKNNWAANLDDLYNLYKEHLHSAKDCGAVSGCFNQGKYKLLNGNSSNNWETNENVGKMILSDGIQLYISLDSETCSKMNSNDLGSNNICAHINVDLNGKKLPNTIGRDVFMFVLKEDGLYPSGCDVDDLCNTSKKGYACACKVLNEGEINY